MLVAKTSGNQHLEEGRRRRGGWQRERARMSARDAVGEAEVSSDVRAYLSSSSANHVFVYEGSGGSVSHSGPRESGLVAS